MHAQFTLEMRARTPGSFLNGALASLAPPRVQIVERGSAKLLAKLAEL